MAAVIVTDRISSPHHRPRSAPPCARPRLAVVPPRRTPTPAVYAWRRVVAVLLALVVVAAVALGTVGLGRMLDSQRGIPAAVTATGA